MRIQFILASILLCAAVPADAQVSIGIRSANVSIGINLPVYPQLVLIPGYPVYYASQLDSNYFFYDGMYWVYQDDYWYASTWYNGPWEPVEPEFVPVYVLRVPVRYYRRPPVYFRSWSRDASPRWDEHWGNQWAQRRSGWDRWDRKSVPAPAPLPVYQRQFTGERYPQAQQQQVLRNKNYSYQPRDPVVRQQYQAQPRVTERYSPSPSNQKRRDDEQRAVPNRSAPQTDRASQPRTQQTEPRAEQRQQSRNQDAKARETRAPEERTQEDPKRGQKSDKEKDRQKEDDRGRDR